MTDRAAQAIKAILDRIEHSQGEALRLVAGPDGQLALMLDDVKQDDAIVIEDGPIVFLVIQTPLPDGFEGSTLDIDETPDGTAIMLSH